MNISVLYKGKFEALPPIMSLAHVVKELGHEVEVVTLYSDQKTKDRFAEKEINIVNLCAELECASSNVFGKIAQRVIRWNEVV